MNMLSSQLFDLTAKTALVTGVSRGIGKSMAIALAEAGADIIGVSSGLQAGSEVEKEIEKAGRKFSAFTIDLSDRKALYRSIAEIKSVHPIFLKESCLK